MKQQGLPTKPTALQNETRSAAARRGASIAIALTVMLGSLTACGFGGLLPSDPTSDTETTTAPTQEPTQSETTEPEATTTNAPDPEQTEEQASQKQLFDEAVKTYSEYQKVEITAGKRDGRATVPKELDKYATGEYYDNVVSQVKNADQMKYRLADDAAEKAKLQLRPYKDPQNKEALVSLDVCLDLTAVDFVEKGTGTPITKGMMIYRKVAMKRVDGSLKIFNVQAKKVAKCPIKGQSDLP